MQLDWEMIHKYLSLIFSWPTVALAIAILFKRPISDAMGRLDELKGFGQELKFSRLLEETELGVERIQKQLLGRDKEYGEAPESPKHSTSDANIGEVSEKEPSHLILRSWESLQQLTQTIARGISEDHLQSRRDPMATLLENGIANSSTLEQYTRLRNLRNEVAHGRHRPTPGEALAYAHTARNLGGLILSISRHPSRSHLTWATM